MNFQSLADFGFNSSLIRAYSHATGGAKSIKSYKDSNIKVDTNKEINWNLIEKIYSTVKYMSLGLSVLFIILLSTFGTYSVKKLINQVNNPYEAWIAWIVIIIATGINIYGAKYSVFIKGMNKIPLFMRWQTLFSVLSIFPLLEDFRTSLFAHGNLSKYLSHIPIERRVTSKMIVDSMNLPPNPRKAGGSSSVVNTVAIEEKHKITPKIPMIIPGNITSSEIKMIPASANIITNDINYFLENVKAI